jgi:hypothetical protein
VTFTRGVALVALASYILLWAIALHGASSLIPVLAIPLILAVLVALLVWLQQFMGIKPRPSKFEKPDESDPS